MGNNSDEPEKMTIYRWKLASRITGYAIMGISLVAGLAIYFSDTRPQTAQMVFTSVVPLLASWVGTVLAYYYSSESMDAATRSVKELMPVEEKLKAIPVSKVMIRFSEMTTFKYDDTQKVQDILKTLKIAAKGERLPFLDDKNYPIYMLHKSAIDSALVEASGQDKGLALAEVTLQQLFDKVPRLKEMAIGSFGALGQDATLEAARSEMMRIKNCQDIFITEKGTKDGPVVGWITNGIIEENSKL
jgi:hypothetical protein